MCDATSEVGLLGIDYVHFHQCTMEGSPLSWMLLVLMLGALFYLLGDTADTYFSPILGQICDTLKISYGVAGVTFLAFGNGAPDVFSSIAAFSSSADGGSQDGADIGLNALLGAGVFVTTAVVGAVALTKEVRIQSRAFIRDVLAYAIVLCLLLLAGVLPTVGMSFAFGFMIFYLIYVGVVIIMDRMGRTYVRRQRLKRGGAISAGFFGAAVEGVAMSVTGSGTPRAGGLGYANGAHADAEESESMLTQELITFRDEDSAGGGDPVADAGVNAEFDVALGGGAGAGADLEEGGGGGGGGYDDGNGYGYGGEGGGGGGAGESNGNAFAAAMRDSVAGDRLESGGRRGRGRHGRGKGKGKGKGKAKGTSRGKDKGQQRAHEDGFMYDIIEDYFAADKPPVHARDDPSGIGGTSFAPLPDLVVHQVDSGGADWDAIGPAGSDPTGSGLPPQFTGRGGRFLTSVYWARVRWQRDSRRQAFWALWRDMAWYRRALWALNYPTVLARNLTIPMVEQDSWSRGLAIASPIVGLQFIGWIAGEEDAEFLGMRLGSALLLCGGIASAVLFFVTHEHRPPSSTPVLAGMILGGFVSCVCWIYALANELVVLLQAFGALTGTPAGVLGLTVLAWGNSVGDMVSNVSVAKAGLGEMAIAGCYGGPLFNLLIGLGISLTLQCARSGTAALRIDTYARISLGFLFVTLAMTLMVVSSNRYIFTKQLGRVLVAIYLFYSGVNLAVLLS